LTAIHQIKIHPAIGIARIGDAPGTGGTADHRADFFVGPIEPGTPAVPDDGYKIAGQIKRQAAEFRLFAYDTDGNVLKEITADEANITWTVQLANKKASWLTFDGLKTGTNRNPAVTTDADRARLNISSSARQVSGRSSGPQRFDDGTFTGFDAQGGGASVVPVPLGEIMTNAEGRLWVLGGHGKSGSPCRVPITDYANNDGWYDDTSDGSVDAQVTLKDGTTMQALGAWVLCNVPKYAPQMQNFLTMYDTLLDVAVERGLMPRPIGTEFYRDIQPFLERIVQTRWTMGIGPAHDFAVAFANTPDAAQQYRQAIFQRLRSPLGDNQGLMNMPMIFDDDYNWQSSGNAGLAVTRLQYEHLQRWADMKSTAGVPIPPVAEVTPAGMDQAALENCCGGPFYPGMEASWMLRDTFVFSEPFRLACAQPSSVTGVMEPGDVTKQMALPWQADFLECRRDEEKPYLPGWWPQQRPEMVTEFGQSNPVQWTRGIPWEDHLSMVVNWSQLGFILRRAGGYYETDRGTIAPVLPDAVRV
jgi:hypothetical protein